MASPLLPPQEAGTYNFLRTAQTPENMQAPTNGNVLSLSPGRMFIPTCIYGLIFLRPLKSPRDAEFIEEFLYRVEQLTTISLKVIKG